MSYHFLSFQLGISSRGGCRRSSDQDYRIQITTIAYALNSVSAFALDFGHGLALDFGLDYI